MKNVIIRILGSLIFIQGQTIGLTPSPAVFCPQNIALRHESVNLEHNAEIPVTLRNCQATLQSNCGNERQLDLTVFGTPSDIEWLNTDTDAEVSSTTFWTVPTGTNASFEIRIHYGADLVVVPFSVWEGNTFEADFETFYGIHYLYGDNTIEGNTTVSVHSHVENLGDLLVASGASLGVEGTIFNGSLASIECLSGSLITLFSEGTGANDAHGTLRATHCPTFWGGIIFEPTARMVAQPGSQIMHMGGGIGTHTNGVPGLPPIELEMDGVNFTDNVFCFQFTGDAKGYIRNCTASYAGTDRRAVSIQNCWGNADPDIGCDEKGFAFLSFNLAEDYRNPGLGSEDLEINGNNVTRYLMGIYASNQNGTTTNRLTFRLSNNTFSGCDRGVNIMPNCDVEAFGNTFINRSPADNEAQYRHFSNPANPEGVIGELFGGFPSFCSIYMNGTGSSLVADGNFFYGLGALGLTDYGIHVRGNGHTLAVNGNEFHSPAIGMQIQSGQHTLESFRCNEFFDEQDAGTALPHIGLHIGVEPGNTGETATGALNGPIGNSGLGTNPKLPDPSGNVWPVDPLNSTTPWPIPPGNTDGVAIMAGWVSPANWTSLQNDNPFALLEYWAYDNEYVRPLSDNTSTNLVRRRPSGNNQVMVYPEGTTPPTTSGIDFVEQCSPTLPDVFPLPLRPANSNANEVTERLSDISNHTGMVALGDAVPNPSAGTTRIPVFVPVNHSGSVWLQLFNLTGRAIRWQTELRQTGSQWVEVSLEAFPPGVYGYSLVDNGKMVGNRKLVVIR